MAVWLSMSLSQGTPNETARTNTVTASVKVHYSGGSYNGNSPSGTLMIDGQSFSFTCNFNYAGIGQGATSTGTGSVTACTRTVTVSYGSSSTRTVSASASFASGTASGTVTASDSIALTSISAGGSSGGGDDDDDNTEEWDPDNPGSGGSGSGTVEKPDNALPGNCEVIGQACFPTYPDYSYNYPETSVIDRDVYLGSSKYVVIKFKTPDFSDIPHSLSVNLYEFRLEQDSSYYYFSMCYALCTSDENIESYNAAASDVYDQNQIACGLVTREEAESMPFVIPTDNIKSNTVYYLVLWQASDEPTKSLAKLGIAAGHGITVNYASSGGDSGGDEGGDSGDDVITPIARGVFYIEDGTTFEAYEGYIEDGTAWFPIVGGSGYTKAEGTVTTTTSDTAASVDCGFVPDLVVLHCNEKYYGYDVSCAADLSVHSDGVNTGIWIENLDSWVDTYIERQNEGFAVSTYVGGTLVSVTFDYVAVKYT